MSERKFAGFGRRRFMQMLLGTAISPVLGRIPAAFASSGPEDYVNGIADQVMALANSGSTGNALRGKFAALLSRYINLRTIANYALGPYQSKLPAGRRDEFYRLVSNYAAALFVYYVDDFKGSDLEITSTSTQGSFVTILSAIKQKGGGREQVRWRLTPAGGSYRVSDVNIKGVWLTISMKDRFSKVLKKSNGDFGPLFDELRSADTW